MSPLKEVGRYGTVGLEFVISLVIGYAGGRWLDRRFDTHGWLLWLGIVVGLYSGIRVFQRTARDMRREIERRDREEPWFAASGDHGGEPDERAPGSREAHDPQDEEHGPD